MSKTPSSGSATSSSDVSPFQVQHVSIEGRKKTCECPICHEQFTMPESLIQHKRKYHSENFEIFLCRVCKYATVELRNINRHFKSSKHISQMLDNNVPIGSHKKIEKYIYKKQPGVPYLTKSDELIKLLEAGNYNFPTINIDNPMAGVLVAENGSANVYNQTMSEQNEPFQECEGDEEFDNECNDYNSFNLANSNESWMIKKLRSDVDRLSSNLMSEKLRSEKIELENRELREKIKEFEEEKFKSKSVISYLEDKLTDAVVELKQHKQSGYQADEVMKQADTYRQQIEKMKLKFKKFEIIMDDYENEMIKLRNRNLRAISDFNSLNEKVTSNKRPRLAASTHQAENRPNNTSVANSNLDTNILTQCIEIVDNASNIDSGQIKAQKDSSENIRDSNA